MLTLGLDPSLTSYGWCVYDNTKVGVEKVVERGRWKTTAAEDEIARYLYLRASLRTLVRKYDIKQAGMETPPVGSVSYNQERLYALYIYNVEVMYTEKVNVVFFAPTQLTLLAKRVGSTIEKRHWDKPEMVWTARADLLSLSAPLKRREALLTPNLIDRALADQFPFIDDKSFDKDTQKALKFQADEADAYHAARFGSRFWEYVNGSIPEGDLSPSEWDVFVKSHTYKQGPKKGTTESEGISFKEGSRFFRFSALQ